MLRQLGLPSSFWQNMLPFLLLCLPVNALYVFTNPPPFTNGPENRSDDPIYHIGTTLDIQWKESQSNRISIVLWHAIPNSTGEYVFHNVAGLQSYKWTVQTLKNLTLSDEFFFLMYAEGNNNYVARSRQFIINKNSANASSTINGSSPTVSDATLASISASGSPVASISRSGLSRGAKAGIGVGVGVGVMAIAGIAFFIFLTLRRCQAKASGGESEYTNWPVEAGATELFEAPGTKGEMAAELDQPARDESMRLRANMIIDMGNRGPQELYVPMEIHQAEEKVSAKSQKDDRRGNGS